MVIALNSRDYMDPMQQGELQAAGVGIVLTLFYLFILVFSVVVGWKIFVKAGKPGWAAIIPIYNLIVLLEIVGRPIWWVILMFIPLANLIVSVILCFDLAKSFGKSVGFGLGLLLLGIVFAPILAFGSASYKGPAAQAAPAPA